MFVLAHNFICSLVQCSLIVSLLYSPPRPKQSSAIQFFADCLHVETNLLQFVVFQYFSPVEDVRRFDHLLINGLVVEFLYRNEKQK